MNAQRLATRERWRERVGSLAAFLNVFEPMRIPEVQEGDVKRAWKDDVRRQLASLQDADLEVAEQLWSARLEDTEAARASVNGRANNLLLFVGIITTGAALVAGTIQDAAPRLAFVIVVVGALLLWAAFCTAFLAVRAQRVGVWDAPWLDMGKASGSEDLRVERAVEVYVAAHQNKHRLRGPVGLLAQAQQYALISLSLIAILAALSVLAPPAGEQPQSGSQPESTSDRPTATAVSEAVLPALRVARLTLVSLD